MKEQCGCCSGTQVVVPVPEANPPGLTALKYRVGTYSEFLESALARLSTVTVDVPSTSGSGTDHLRPLANLTTRDPSDPSIALLDAWAVVGDVLTFYQERIANEGYLPTAVERRSVLELARLIGYRLRPGVAASVKLAFTVASGFSGILPAGTRAQSIPKAGQNPQFFETSADLQARDTWNALPPRMTRPQLITPAATDPTTQAPLVTGADVIDAVYLDGITTNIKPADALLFIFGSDTSATPAQQYLRFAADVDAQAAAKRTEITLDLLTSGRTADQELGLYIDKANLLFPGSDLAQQVVNVLTPVQTNIASAPELMGDLLQPAVSRITLIRDVAVKRGFTRVAAWLAMLLKSLQRMSLGEKAVFFRIAARHVRDELGGAAQTFQKLPDAPEAWPLKRLRNIVDDLATPPSQQPPGPLQLTRSVAASFSPQSDIAPRLLGALKPAAAATLYEGWSAVATPAGRVQVYAARAKTGLFAASWAGYPTTHTDGNQNTTTTYAQPSISTAWPGMQATPPTTPAEVPLDAVYDQIKPGSWIAIKRNDPTATPVTTVTFHIVSSLRTASVATPQLSTQQGSTASGGSSPPLQSSGFAAKVTLLTLDPPWLSELVGHDTQPLSNALQSTDILRQTVVYAQSELMTLAEEPLDTDVEGDSIDLSGVYDGLEAGRFVIVSGTRTDVPGTSVVSASELAMISSISQGEQAAQCVAFPLSSPPFATIYYVTDANAYGDRLVVGKLARPARDGVYSVPDTRGSPVFVNQQYCGQVQLAEGHYANAYVPTQAELRGAFPDFEGLLIRPVDSAKGRANRPYPGGRIDDIRRNGTFAWRISSPALHTVLNLAAPLAYQYDRGTLTIYGNVADATHGQSTGEVLGNGDATVDFASFPLRQSPLTYVSAPTPSGISSTLTSRVNELEWHEIDNLFEAAPRQRCYITRENDAQQTNLTFGNGTHGSRLPTGTANIKATYRYGLGSVGNVEAGQISQLATRPLGAQGVINPLRASGGADADRLDQARSNAPLAVIALDRLVSVTDYADFTRTYAGIGKALSTLVSDGHRQWVHVTIAGADDIPIDTSSDLYRNLKQSLLDYGDPRQALDVGIRRVRLLVMAATVALLPDYDWDTVSPQVRSAILQLFSFDARALGQAAYRSEAIAAAQGVEGVSWVDVTTFDSVGEDITAAELASLGTKLGVQPFVAAELPELDPGGTGAIRPAELVFMSPDITDTLILTQPGT